MSDTLDKRELLDWLEESVDRYTFLQVTHPHLAQIPTKKDKQAYQQIVALIKNQPTITEKDVRGWADTARGWDLIDGLCENIEDTMKEMLEDIGVSITVDRRKSEKR